MARKKKNEATVVASPRSRKATDENINKLKSRGQEQEKNIISIITDKDTNAFSDFAKFLEQHFNEHIKKEIKKKLN
jgi:hypothetical protein